jgi:dihydroneopterin aldolase
MSTVYIRDLVIEAKHGVHDREKVSAQRFNINLELDVDTPGAFTSDDVNDTVSYSELRQIIIDTVTNNTFDLIERLAQEIINNISADRRINTITVAIEKLDVYPSGVPGIRITQQNSKDS